MKIRRALWLFPALLLASSSMFFAQDKKAVDADSTKGTVLKAADVGGKLFPEKVYFRGQSASVQARNSGGVRYADDFTVLAALVDNSGYSSGIKEKYQGYLISEVTLEIGGKTLGPGAFGFGFIEGDKFVVMDLGANDVFQTGSTKDTEIKRPVPLQILPGSAAGNFRLYKGRDYVEFHRVK